MSFDDKRTEDDSRSSDQAPRESRGDAPGLTPVRTNLPLTTSVGTTGNFTNDDINGLLMGKAWNTTTLTYSFPTVSGDYGAGYGNPAALAGFQPLSADQKAVVVTALALIAQYTGLTLTEIAETPTTHANLRFAATANSDEVPTSAGYYPWEGGTTAGDVWFGNIRNEPWTKAGYAYDTVLHELGHALGLKHGNATYNGFPVLPAAHDSTEWTVMTSPSYLGASGNYYLNVEGSGNQTYMANDIAALQYLYGANFNTNSGATTYTFDAATGEVSINGVGQGASITNTIYQSIWDGGGVDTYDLSNYATAVTIDLRPGEWSTFSTAQLADLDATAPGAHLAHGNILNAHLYNGDTRSLIDNANGGWGADTIRGNQGANTLMGNGGPDSLYGMEADDIIYGGVGVDLLEGGAGNDALHGGAGNDTISGGTGSADEVYYTEVTTAISGNAASGWVNTGDGSIDKVTGVEIWRLGSGADTLITWAAQEIVYAGGGNDWVADYGANQNNSFYGGDGDDSLYGLGGADNLFGGNGADFLVGGDGDDQILAGAGIDWMDGQGGADTFYIDLISEIQGGWEAIANFQSGSDKIRLSNIDADGNAANGDTAFTVTTSGFTNTAGQIFIDRPVGQSYAFVRFDINGDSAMDAILFVTGTALTSGDFIL